MLEFKTFSAEQTVDLAYHLGRLLKKSDMICLNGDLGAGKTAFTGGIAKALGVEGYVTSPTFTIVNEYKASIPLYHFDVYRIADSEEMFEIGFEEYIEGSGVTVIEWSELIENILPSEYISINITKDLSGGQDARVICMDFRGERYKQLEKQFSGDNGIF